ncbi:thymidine phosphorylase [Roseiconus nitratireducens]|uniref:thymidine phosphorylase n=1 Tax=Roseiconus nitratireducens TaxID=2605748 RepID=A0A5M6DL57_9BACT|nr:thymidine phosphorylase [Roseiconus nitratireducens]KAA5546982.1 thymidine phosphorylase [Roseiconus nitratireducens]
MLAANLLVKKREGEELSDREIRFLIEGFCDNTVADYQMSALAMAICLRGMSTRETTTLTDAMLRSGDRLSRDASGDLPRVDKHSTGGLGDKVSLVLAPLLAACGVHVPMISGRGLGLSGGTLDKLESIPGLRTNLSGEAADDVLNRAGAFIIGASESIAPADRRLYALRDVTGTVESVPLITASILSKKLAANLDALVMDVKVGGGAFMKTQKQAAELATSLRQVGNAAGLPTSTLLSDMDQPLGRAIGNAIEVNEAVAVLQNQDTLDPALTTVRELTLALSAPLLLQVGFADDASEAKRMLEKALQDGSAMERFELMVAGQGGRWEKQLPVAPGHVIEATEDGFVAGIDCRAIGTTIVSIGGGRRQTQDPIDPAVGIECRVRIGERVLRGQPILVLHCHRNQESEYLDGLRDVVTVTPERVSPNPVVICLDGE